MTLARCTVQKRNREADDGGQLKQLSFDLAPLSLNTQKGKDSGLKLEIINRNVV